MAELPDDTLRFIDAARAVCVACGSATFTQPSEASPALQMQFATSDNATKFVHAMGDLFRASGFLSCSTPVVVPEMTTVLSSAALTMLSAVTASTVKLALPAGGLIGSSGLTTGAGATLSMVMSWLSAAPALPAVSCTRIFTVEVLVKVPSTWLTAVPLTLAVMSVQVTPLSLE